MSKRRVISQREARRTAKELRELQEKHQNLTSKYGSGNPGTYFWQINGHHVTTQQQFATVEKLGFGVAARMDGDILKLYAVKKP